MTWIARWKWSGRRLLVLGALALAMVVTSMAAADRTVPAAEAAGAVDSGRDQYIQAVEPICRKNTRQNGRILKGVRREVRKGRYSPATRKFRLATRAFTQTLKRVTAIPRPAADRVQLGRWIREMRDQRTYLARVTKALQRRDGFKAQRLSLHLISNAHRANLIVADYGFRHCILRPEAFM